jgi:trehalose 2-sulfotransferase
MAKPGEVRPEVSYFVCTLPRSGSWLLSESLEKTGVAGRPREYFEPKLFEDCDTLDATEPLNGIVRKGTTRNGVFSAKLHWYQFEFAPRLIAPGSVLPVPIVINSRFPGLRYVWLMRRDKVRQAVSYYRASETGLWWQIPGVNANEAHAPTLEFNFQRIAYLERILLRHESQWQQYFENHDIEPLVLIYEEFINDHESAVRDVMSYIGVELPEQADIRPRLLRQADSLTEEWVERYTMLKQQECD